jgi:hypothetical protein
VGKGRRKRKGERNSQKLRHGFRGELNRPSFDFSGFLNTKNFVLSPSSSFQPLYLDPPTFVFFFFLAAAVSPFYLLPRGRPCHLCGGEAEKTFQKWQPPEREQR